MIGPGGSGGQLDPADFERYGEALTQVVCDEQGLGDLPIVIGMDFGHTDPIMILPYGVLREMNCGTREVRIVEPAVVH